MRIRNLPFKDVKKQAGINQALAPAFGPPLTPLHLPSQLTGDRQQDLLFPRVLPDVDFVWTFDVLLFLKCNIHL